MAKAGAPERFCEAHINWVFYIISRKEPIGRKALVVETGLGEGSIRTILQRLAELNLVESCPEGRKLNSRGKKTYARMKKLLRCKDVKLDFCEGNFAYAISIKGAAKKASKLTERKQNSAIFLTFENGDLLAPNEGKLSLSQNSLRDFKLIDSIFKPEEGDAIAVGNGKCPRDAHFAAWRCATEIL